MKKPYSHSPRILYHCTLDNHGDVLEVVKRAPSRSIKEPSTPRLCVAPSVALCLAARLFYHARRPVYVYRTPLPRRGITPKDVWDEPITFERWLIPPARLVYDRTLSLEAISSAQRLVYLYHKRTGQTSGVTMRVYQYLLACKQLPEVVQDFDNRWIAILRRRWGDDPVEWFNLKLCSSSDKPRTLAGKPA